jgi:hypothetical protein
MTNDFLRGYLRRIHPGIQPEAVGARHGGEIIAVKIADQLRSRRYLAPCNPVGIADSAQCLFARTVQEDRKQFCATTLHDVLNTVELRAIVRLGIAEGRDEQRDVLLGGGFESRFADVTDKLPKAGRAEFEDRERQIDGGVIVHQPPRHDPEQRFCDRQLAGRGRPMEKKQFHAISIANSSIRGNR